jgi:hypothetical protein
VVRFNFKLNFNFKPDQNSFHVEFFMNSVSKYLVSLSSLNFPDNAPPSTPTRNPIKNRFAFISDGSPHNICYESGNSCVRCRAVKFTNLFNLKILRICLRGDSKQRNKLNVVLLRNAKNHEKFWQ